MAVIIASMGVPEILLFKCKVPCLKQLTIRARCTVLLMFRVVCHRPMNMPLEILQFTLTFGA